jgi:alkylated DNA nucleotide flippase Atl1
MRDASPPDQQAFYEQVWSLVRQAPRGKVVSYWQIGQILPYLGPRRWFVI